MRRPLYLALAAALCCLAGCSPVVEYAPPAQKVMPEGPNSLRDRPLLRMRDPDIDHFIIEDLMSYSVGQWRWTRQHPRFRIFVADPNGRELYLRFALIDSVFRQTGTMTISMTVNGRALAAAKYNAPGEYEFSRPVPDDLLREHSPAIVGLDIDPVFIGKEDGAILGIYLDTVGLLKTHAR